MSVTPSPRHRPGPITVATAAMGALRNRVHIVVTPQQVDAPAHGDAPLGTAGIGRLGPSTGPPLSHSPGRVCASPGTTGASGDADCRGMTEPARLDRRALNRALLARQHLIERAELTVPAMLTQLVGMQAQAPAPPYVGLWTRLSGFVTDDLSRLVLERTVARIALMRSTLHLVTADDALGAAGRPATGAGTRVQQHLPADAGRRRSDRGRRPWPVAVQRAATDLCRTEKSSGSGVSGGRARRRWRRRCASTCRWSGCRRGGCGECRAQQRTCRPRTGSAGRSRPPATRRRCRWKRWRCGISAPSDRRRSRTWRPGPGWPACALSLTGLRDRLTVDLR